MSGEAKKGLDLWKSRLAQADAAYKDEVQKMDRRELIYGGDRTLEPLVIGDTERDGTRKKTSIVRNILMELVEAQINSSLPMPKVTPVRERDQHLAEVIEVFLRNEMDRLPFETINDIAERMVPVHGGTGYLVEWDNAARTHTTVGELCVSHIHPRQFAPQPGVYTSVEDMDWFILKIPSTKAAVKRKYKVDVRDESESEPEVRSTDTELADDAVTVYMGYEKADGGINRFVWVNNTELENVSNYQGRRIEGETVEYEEVFAPIPTENGIIPGATPILDSFGNPVLDELQRPIVEPTRIPYYVPDVMPLVLQRNVSTYGQLLGSSDVDAIADIQNAYNRLSQKALERLVKAGSMLALPDDTSVRVDTEEMKVYYTTPAEKQVIEVLDLSVDISQTLALREQLYQEARQTIGVTDSFQGRRDSTATSGKAKEFAAAQTAGRLESKRVMKDAAYASIFEMMFKFSLAYSDEPRTIVTTDYKGNKEYMTFSRYDFLERDDAGEWYWNDRFLFSVDATAPLASNREAMWQELRQNLQSGAFGDPTQTSTLILFWSRMEGAHYPGAGETKKYLEEKQQQEQMAQQQAAMLRQSMVQPPGIRTGEGVRV
jgi:hypothetical protein